MPIRTWIRPCNGCGMRRAKRTMPGRSDWLRISPKTPSNQAPSATSHHSKSTLAHNERHDVDHVSELQQAVQALGGAVAVVGLLANKTPQDDELTELHQ